MRVALRVWRGVRALETNCRRLGPVRFVRYGGGVERWEIDLMGAEDGRRRRRPRLGFMLLLWGTDVGGM